MKEGNLLSLAGYSIKLEIEVLMNAWWASCEFGADNCWDFVIRYRRTVAVG